MRIGILQLHVTSDKLVNLEHAESKIKLCASHGVDLIVLPEMFCCPYDSRQFKKYAEPEGGFLWNKLSAIAKEYRIYLVSGSIPELANKQIYNTCFIFDPLGHPIAKHRKVHLFSINVPGKQTFDESTVLSAGNDYTIFPTPFGTVGVMICYDIRFPEFVSHTVSLGADIIIVPASFNMASGPLHWELLFRSRAMDHQIFMIGCASSQDTGVSYISYANSIAVAPTGEIIKKLGISEDYMIVDVDFSLTREIRTQMPYLSNRRENLY